MGAGVLLGQKKTDLKDVIGQYAIFSGSESITVNDTTPQSVTLNTTVKNTSKITNYVSLNNGDILLSPGIYRINGKVKFSSNSQAVGVWTYWRMSTDQSSFDTTITDNIESQTSEAYIYIPDNASEVHANFNPTTVEITEPTYIRIGYVTSANTMLVVSEEGCRIQVTKLK